MYECICIKINLAVSQRLPWVSASLAATNIILHIKNIITYFWNTFSVYTGSIRVFLRFIYFEFVVVVAVYDDEYFIFTLRCIFWMEDVRIVSELLWCFAGFFVAVAAVEWRLMMMTVNHPASQPRIVSLANVHDDVTSQIIFQQCEIPLSFYFTFYFTYFNFIKKTNTNKYVPTKCKQS